MKIKSVLKMAGWATLLLMANLAVSQSKAEISQKEVREAMRKATDFMMTTVSNKGGFLWKYSADLSEQWGEIPARKSQIWVQPPGTASVGNVLLEAFNITADRNYLIYADKVAEALIWGQHPSGGWHYLIDFDSAGLSAWYEQVAAKCWGWEEYYHYYGNATFDDGVTLSAARFLLNIYLTSGNQKYMEPLQKALDFILEAQYPNGAWPQRYPFNHDVQEEHHDYTPYYTYNDDVIHGNIMFLLEVYEKLGGEEYKDAAFRGMDFYLLSQLAAPQAGWALQYDLQMNPGLARSYEPAAIASGQTVRNIRDLESFYKITGNAKYLKPIPDAIAWLKNSIINTDTLKNFTHATFYQLETNKPLFAHREGTSIDNGRYWVDHEQRNFPGHYGMLRKIDVASIKREYERVRSLTVQQAKDEYLKSKIIEASTRNISSNEMRNIIFSLDERGAWLEDLSIPHYPDVVGQPRRIVKGINTQTYISNMQKLLDNLIKQ